MPPKLPRLSPVTVGAATIAAALGSAFWLDLTPRVEPDFFFADDDAQFQETKAIERDFPSPSQIVVRVASRDIRSDSYRTALAELAAALSALPDVLAVRSIANTPHYQDPLWSPLLLSRDRSATNLLLDVTQTNPSSLVDQINATVANRNASDITIQISGAPYVVELIRRSLMRDLVIFSIAAMAVFGVAIALVYRRLWIATGTLLTALFSALLTLSVLQLAGVTIGLLTANLITIVFVLTLSHVVFLTSNWRREVTAATGLSNPTACVRTAVRKTLLPSFWCMTTTTLGFLSLLVASAKPLRQLGYAGATGAVVSIVAAFLVYPVFLRATKPYTTGPGDGGGRLPQRGRAVWLGVFGAVAIIGGLGVPRLSTDPTLLTYFSAEGPIRRGLELIDQDGGSSPLSLVLTSTDGRPFDEPDGPGRLLAVHDHLAADPDVGTVVSPSLLLAEFQRSPLTAHLSPKQILDIPLVAPISSRFFSADRRQAHFMLRMREAGRTTPRAEVISRIEQSVAVLGFEPILTGGLYDLMAKLADLIRSSLRLTLAGLIALFAAISWLLTRSIRTTLALATCLAVVPVVILGTFGHAGVALDIISSPAANVALAMGVDSMIHLVIRARSLAACGHTSPWRVARDQLQHPIAGAALIIAAGFGIFAASAFPPTVRFGLAVILGTATAAIMALVAMPMLAASRGGSMKRGVS